MILGALLAIAAVCLVAMLRPWATPGATSAASDEVVAAPPPLVLAEQPRLLVFGDSWVYGLAAATPDRGFAYLLADLLGGETIVDGEPGSGYLKPGWDGGTYGSRIAALDASIDPDVIVVEGTINDRRLHPTGYVDAVTEAWDALAARFPDAAIVILGPAPQVLPVERATAAIDRDLASLAAARGWWYISPIAGEWITPENYLSVIDTGEIGRDHPSTDGHAYLASKVADALRALATAPSVIAEAPVDDTGLAR